MKIYFAGNVPIALDKKFVRLGLRHRLFSFYYLADFLSFVENICVGSFLKKH